MRCLELLPRQAAAGAASSSPDAAVATQRIGGIGTFSGRAPLAPGGLPGFTGPFPSTSLDKGICNWQVRCRILTHLPVES